MTADVLAGTALLLVAVWLLGSSLLPDGGAEARLAAGACAVVAVAWLFMLQAPLGVGLLGHRWLLVGLSATLPAAAYAWRRPPIRARHVDWATVALVGAGTAIVVAPALRLPIVRLAPSYYDTEWHRGWIDQLAGGAPAPGGFYANQPNDYPWLFHSLGALLIQVLPGGMSACFAVIQIFGVAAGGFGMWLLTRHLGAGPAAARWSVLLFCFAGGVGWIWQHKPAGEIAFHHGFSPYRGDFALSVTVVPGLAGVPPLMPRELSLLLTPVALWLLLRALDQPRSTRLVVAGAAAGWLYLIGPISGILLAGWGIVLAVRERCVRIWIAVAAAFAASAVWLGPLAVDYLRYGGLVKAVNHPPPSPTFSQVLVAFGLLAVLGPAGVALLARGRTQLDRGRITVLLALPLLLCGIAAIVPSGSSVLATPALLSVLRYLPYLALALAIPAGCAADAAVRLAGRVAPPAAVLVGAGLALAATASTALALVWVDRNPSSSYLACSPRPALGPADEFAIVTRPSRLDWVSLALFSDTGASAYYVSDRHVKVRFRTWLSTTTPQSVRKRALIAYKRGQGPLPAGIDWLFAERGYPVHGAGLIPSGRCSFHGTAYRVFRVTRR